MQTGVKQPIIEIRRDQVIKKLLKPLEQPIEPQDSLENDGTTLKRSNRTKRSANS